MSSSDIPIGRLERGEIAEGETGGGLRQRVGSLLQEVVSARGGQQMAFVCHGGVIRVMLALLLRLPLGPLGSFEVEYGSLIRVDLHAHRTALHLLNFAPWRDLS